MKSIAFLLLSWTLITACTHHDDAPPATAAPPPPVATAQSFGTTNGQEGGPCDPQILADYRVAQNSCGSGDLSGMAACQDALNLFSSQHPNVNCSTSTGSETITIKTSHSSSNTSTHSEVNEFSID